MGISSEWKPTLRRLGGFRQVKPVPRERIGAKILVHRDSNPAAQFECVMMDVDQIVRKMPNSVQSWSDYGEYFFMYHVQCHALCPATRIVYVVFDDRTHVTPAKREEHVKRSKKKAPRDPRYQPLPEGTDVDRAPDALAPMWSRVCATRWLRTHMHNTLVHGVQTGVAALSAAHAALCARIVVCRSDGTVLEIAPNPDMPAPPVPYRALGEGELIAAHYARAELARGHRVLYRSSDSDCFGIFCTVHDYTGVVLHMGDVPFCAATKTVQVQRKKSKSNPSPVKWPKYDEYVDCGELRRAIADAYGDPVSFAMMLGLSPGGDYCHGLPGIGPAKLLAIGAPRRVLAKDGDDVRLRSAEMRSLIVDFYASQKRLAAKRAAAHIEAAIIARALWNVRYWALLDPPVENNGWNADGVRANDPTASETYDDPAIDGRIYA